MWPPVWLKNCRKCLKYNNLPIFDIFWAKKGVKMLSDLNFEASFGILSLKKNRLPFVIIFRLWFFDLLCIIWSRNNFLYPLKIKIFVTLFCSEVSDVQWHKNITPQRLISPFGKWRFGLMDMFLTISPVCADHSQQHALSGLRMERPIIILWLW